MSESVADYLRQLAPEPRAMIEALRQTVMACGLELAEEIKWNAPSFSYKGQDRVTLGVGPRGDVRLVLHRGAKVQDSAGFAFEDTSGLFKWPSPDRGVATFKNLAAIEAAHTTLSDMVKRWVEYNA